MQTLLQIVQAFARRTALPVPSAIVGSQNAATQQMLGLLEEVGEELVSRFPWQQLRRKASWVVATATSDQGNIYTLAGESLERILPGSFINETQRTYVQGPIPERDWQSYVAGTIASADTLYTVSGDKMLLWPVPTVGETFSFYWQSSEWIVDSGGTTFRRNFAVDTDKPLFDETLMRLGLRYKWKMEKGLPYAEELRAFEGAAADKSSRGMTQPILSMADGVKALKPTITVPLYSTIPNA